MKRTLQDQKEEKKRVFDYMHTAVDLNIQNVKIVWKTGAYIAILFAALFVASYYVSEQVIAWLIYLMPLGAYLVSRRYRVRKTEADIQFHLMWQNMWGIAAGLAIFPYFFALKLAVGPILLIYYISLMVGLVMLFESMRVRYASMVLCASCGIGVTGARLILESEGTIRAYLALAILFYVISFMIGGAAMQWQVKNRIKNPINFPQPK